MLIGYANFSKTSEEDSVRQLEALERAGCEKIFEDYASGGRWGREALRRLMEEVRKGDIVVVWKLECLTRSIKDFLVLLDRLNREGARFQSLTEDLDPTSESSEMFMRTISLFAEFERQMIRERVKVGLALASNEGRRGGRPPSLSARQRVEICESIFDGLSSGAEMARRYHVSPATIARILSQYRQEKLG